MAINYTPFESSLGNTGTMINTINKMSPNPKKGAGGMPTGISGNMWNQYGMNPDQIKSGFTEAYGQASNAYDPFPAYDSLEDVSAYRNQLGQVPAAYDVSDTLSKMQGARRMNLNVGQMSANTVAQNFQATQLPGSANNIGASVLRAQSLLPYLQQDYQGAAAEGQYADSAKQKALDKSSEITNALAGLQSKYLDTLANYNSGKAKGSLDYANNLLSLQLQSSGQNQSDYLNYATEMAKLKESARSTNLNAALQNRGLDLNASANAKNQEIDALKTYLAGNKAPTGSWITDAMGRVTSGQGAYEAYKNYTSGQNNALSNLANLGA